jgi:hypothetical protein
MKKITFFRNLIVLVALLVGSGSAMGQSSYGLVTSTDDLVAGAKYLIVSTADGNGYALGLQNSNNRASVAVSVNSGMLSTIPATVSTDTKPFEITLGGSIGQWTLFDEVNNGYLYAGSSSSNHLKNKTDQTNWTITFSSNTAVMTSAAQSTRNILRFNSSNNPPLFSCYSSGQASVYLYKLQEGGAETVSTPTFSPTSGNYLTTQNVTISTETEGATIYYTTDGSDPDNTDTEYTTPIAVSATTTVKAIAYKTDMDPSAIASATYTFPTEVANIAALRAGTTGSTVYKLTGEAVMTLKSSNNNVKYIQDATGGILIYDASGIITTAYNVNDGITGITGTLSLFNGMLQFIPVTDPGVATSTNNTVTPVEATLTNYGNYPGQLVKITGLTIAETGSFAASTNYTLSDGTNSGVLRTAYSDLPYIGSAIPTVPQDIVGVVLIYNSTAQLVPRTADDFSNTVIESPTIFVAEVNVPAMSAYVDASDSETITVNGVNLTTDITLSLGGADAAQFRLSTSTLAQTDGSVTDASVTIYYEPKAAGSHTATLTLSSAGAADEPRSLSGTATWAPLDAPVATDASGISQTGFTANWNAVAGATEYELSVYTKEESVVNATDLFISEYIEGSSNNKAIEIFNGTGVSVDLSGYKIELYANGAATASNTQILSGTLANNDVYIIYNSSASAAIKAVGDMSSAVAGFNGDDAIVLKKGEAIIDVFGRIGERPTSAWIDGDYSTLDKTLVRKSTVIGGITVNPASGFPTLATEWDVYAIDNIADLGSHTFAGGGFSQTEISGSPFTVTDGTSKAITGLTPSTTYYYTVKAKNTNVTSEASNEVSVVTSIGTSTDNPSLTSIYAHNANIHFTATAGEKVEVYNAVGQKIISTLATDGQNELPVNAKGVMIVKVGSRLAKVIL